MGDNTFSVLNTICTDLKNPPKASSSARENMRIFFISFSLAHSNWTTSLKMVVIWYSIFCGQTDFLALQKMRLTHGPQQPLWMYT